MRRLRVERAQNSLNVAHISWRLWSSERISRMNDLKAERFVRCFLSVAVACQLYIVAGPVKVGFGEESNICTNGFDILEANLV